MGLWFRGLGFRGSILDLHWAIIFAGARNTLLSADCLQNHVHHIGFKYARECKMFWKSSGMDKDVILNPK